MLDRVDQVDWANLHHAYGAATDVPELLRALASPDSEVRSAAIGDLYGNIWHQGTVYQATGFAVPFLVELLTQPTVEDKTAILALLQAISCGTSYAAVHQSLHGHESRSPKYQEQMRQELNWVKMAKAAVSDGFPVYRDLLANASADVRLFSAYVLANCSDRFQDVQACLIQRLRAERQPIARAGLIWAWTTLVRSTRNDVEGWALYRTRAKRRLRQLARSKGERPIARLMASLGLVQFVPDRDYPNLVRFIGRALARCSEALIRLPWSEGESLRFILSSLAGHPKIALSLFSSIAQDANHPEQESAVYYLEEVINDQPAARPAIAELLGRLLESEDEKVRHNAARLLAQIGRSAEIAVEPLVNALGDSSDDVARYGRCAEQAG